MTPPDWASYELVAMRGLMVLVLLYRGGLPARLPFEGTSHPVGVARMFDLGFMGGSTYARLRRLALPAGLLYATDLVPVVGGLYLTVLVLLAVTFNNSQGAINHGLHLSLVTLVAELAARIAHPVLTGLDVDVDSLLLESAPQTAAWWAVQAILATYFVSGVSKLARTGLLWVGEASRLALAMAVQTEIGLQDHPRAQRQERERRLRVASWLVGRRVHGGLLFAGGLWLELLAPLALANRATLVVGGLALISLHKAIGVVLLLPFKLYQLVLLIYLVNVPYLAVELLTWLGVPDRWLP